jgi:tRNA(Ile)-lysidine synthase
LAKTAPGAKQSEADIGNIRERCDKAPRRLSALLCKFATDMGADCGVPRAVAALLSQALPNGGRVAVAVSGGRDSIALLDAAARVGRDAAVELVAFHVHHGLSANAERWAQFCAQACAARGIPFTRRDVRITRRPRASVEAMARDARYAALADLARAHRVDAVMLAHHADDQAETVLLQLLRGAGPRGLAAMPAIASDRGVVWLRPLLDIARATLDAYVSAQALRYVDDESNTDPRYRRNALRESVLPALRAVAPGYPATLVRAARLQAESAALADALAALDARSAYDGGSLARSALRDLDAPRARNLLRWFLREQRLPAPSASRLAEMVSQLTRAADDARVALVHGGVTIGVHRGRIVVHRPVPSPYVHEWSGAHEVALPHGTLAFAPALGIGIARRHLAGARVTIRAGLPGERLHIAGRSRRAVADLLREAGIPAWDRVALPRIYCGESLAAVACAGVDAAFGAAPGEPAFTLDWHPQPRER